MNAPLTNKQIVAMFADYLRECAGGEDHSAVRAAYERNVIAEQAVASYREAHAAVLDPLADIPEPMRAPLIAYGKLILPLMQAPSDGEARMAAYELRKAADTLSDEARRLLRAERGARAAAEGGAS